MKVDGSTICTTEEMVTQVEKRLGARTSRTYPVEQEEQEENVMRRFNRPHDTLNLRRASEITGVPMGCDGEDGVIVCVGYVLRDRFASPQKYAVAPGNRVVTDILVSDDGLGPNGFYTRITVWADENLLAEYPLHNLEGVTYV